MNNITVTELRNLIPRVKIIDIRDNYEYNLGNIPTSKNIPKNFLVTNPNLYLNQEDTYYVYCQYGNSSGKVCNKLNEQGYKVINVLGGYNEYKNI
ncbi:MAG: rhodanese-like domain-containing protein [bacterium]|nr:rhodanese-like domain-containing protein [bacterium]